MENLGACPDEDPDNIKNIFTGVIQDCVVNPNQGNQFLKVEKTTSREIFTEINLNIAQNLSQSMNKRFNRRERVDGFIKGTGLF